MGVPCIAPHLYPSYSFKKLLTMSVAIICSSMVAWGSGDLTNTEYLEQANSSILVIIQIETKEALDNIDEIAAVNGVDVLFVGPFDLGNSIGASPIT